MIVAIYEIIYGWAWKTHSNTIIVTAKENPVTTIGGAVIIGFVIYQLYYAFYRPVVRLRIPLPWIMHVGVPLYTSDLGGAVLQGLANDPIAVAGLGKAFELESGFEEWEWSRDARPNSTEKRSEYTKVLTERAIAVRNLMNFTFDNGQTRIKTSYDSLADIYHALGACRAALIVTTVAAVIDILAKHTDNFIDHWVRSAGATIFIVVCFWGTWHIIFVNRRESWRLMTSQLRNDLRLWAMMHPELLAKLAESDTFAGTPR